MGTGQNQSDLKNSSKLADILEGDEHIMEVLHLVSKLGLKDWWIGAGFIRNKIWDTLHEKEFKKIGDIDVIFHDATEVFKEYDAGIESILLAQMPEQNWSVKNQARMHLRNNHKQYQNSKDAISYWPETATSVAVSLSNKKELDCIAPYGLDDLFNLVVRKTPKASFEIFSRRLEEKQWQRRWPGLQIVS